MPLLLVEKYGKRYVGEGEVPADLAPGAIVLQNAFELVRAQVMTNKGAQMQHMMLPIGVDGAEPWIVCCPDGFREVGDTDALLRAYREVRAESSGIQITRSMPQAPGQNPLLVKP